MSSDEILCQLLLKECGYYERILELTEEEHRLLQAERPLKTVTQLMKQKQILLACIEEVEAVLKPIKKRWQESKDSSGPHTKSVQNHLDRLDSLLKSTLDLDAKNQKLVQKKLLRLREQAKSRTAKT